MYNMSAAQRYSGKEFGTLQPRLFPSRRRRLVATDFITHLLRNSNDFDAITTYVDRFFAPCSFPRIQIQRCSNSLCKRFLSEPSLISQATRHYCTGCDPNFTFKIWNNLTSKCSVCLCMSFSHHSQTESSSKVMNNMIKKYEWCNCAHHQKGCEKLPLSAKSKNNSFKHECMNFPVIPLLRLTWDGISGAHSMFSAALQTMKSTTLSVFKSFSRLPLKTLNFHARSHKQGTPHTTADVTHLSPTKSKKKYSWNENILPMLSQLRSH